MPYNYKAIGQWILNAFAWGAVGFISTVATLGHVDKTTAAAGLTAGLAAALSHLRKPPELAG